MAGVRTLYRIIAPLSLILVALGTYVRITGAGMACPDWPLCYGQFIPSFIYEGVRSEWGHRFLAAAVGTLTLIAAAKAWTSAQASTVRRFALFLVVLVIVQAVFGGLTVLRSLDPHVVTTHLALGTLFFQTAAFLAWAPFRRSEDIPDPGEFSGVRRTSITLAVLVFIQMVLGGFTASSGASLACPLFPYCPEVLARDPLSAQRLTVILHGSLGLLIIFKALFLLRKAAPIRDADRSIWVNIRIVPALITAQAILGVALIHTQVPPSLVILHQLIAQSILFFLVSLVSRLAPWKLPVASQTI